MTSSRGGPIHAFVWIWLPNADVPVVAGRVDVRGRQIIYGYGKRYRGRSDAIPIYQPELPLVEGPIEPLPGLDIAGCLLDAGPDSWGQRVILQRVLGPEAGDTAELGPLTYLLNSGSNRIGALDFQASADTFVPRGEEPVPLEMLAQMTELIQEGEQVPAALEAALTAGSSVGGARPKALLQDDGREFIAKFSSLTDRYPIVRGEFLAMRMAKLCGLRVAEVRLTTANGKDALLVERFDRIPGTGRRRLMVSALTMLELPETAPHHASYAKLAELIRERFVDPKPTLRELFGRIIFNILSGNTDDHARNHAAFWDGNELSLTPAYDICTYVRSGGEATQAMIIGGSDDPFRFSQVAGCIERAAIYGLTRTEAHAIVEHQLTTIDEHWDDVCDEALLASADRAMFRRMFPNEYALFGYS
jgi:serine/threonine-protein kinase HipA